MVVDGYRLLFAGSGISEYKTPRSTFHEMAPRSIQWLYSTHVGRSGSVSPILKPVLRRAALPATIDPKGMLNALHSRSRIFTAIGSGGHI